MDPYLEGAEWTSVHVELSSEIARQLAPKLRPKYIVRTMRRFITDIPENVSISTGDIYPDVGVAANRSDREPTALGAAVVPAPLEFTTIMPVRIPDISVEIRDVDQRALVTAIGVLSPANKRGEGYREYLRKRHRILTSTTHLIEIDFLHTGRRVPMREQLPDVPYFVFLSRSERRPTTHVWPIRLDMTLPVIPLPLLAGDDDADLDLQDAFTSVYDALGYDLSTDYSRPPHLSLRAHASLVATEAKRSGSCAQSARLEQSGGRSGPIR
ncbi:MAG: hypothetical protein ETSY1_23015 [Candidatus Entotheonella factor]|uniref:DUF4058 domain-containing protein n=2 Tax=Candidatus Entotheonella TaxID=93171 RepID=W4LI13_ENTF1|nr:MAG: hypothetical protein ETSY1_23015 [Candidatus Entotheonella factor]